MTFDPFANQGDTSADPETAAATKRAADRIFSGENSSEDSSSDSFEEPNSDDVADPDASSDV